MMHPLAQYRMAFDPHLSREAIAKAAKTSRQTIYRIEQGEQTPSLDLVARLIDAAGGKLSADDFLPAREAAE